ncbi:MAG: phosphoribosylformylglycinamidine synthase subunit PurS, partial [Phycisphaerae bacterium]
MPRYNVEIRVMPRATLLDPQGKAVENALSELDFGGLSGVRVGKAIHMDLETPDREAAEQTARSMCDRL